MFRPRHRPAKPDPVDRRETAPWPDSLPLAEAREGGESTWALWHEATHQLNRAFAPTEPSMPAPLSTGTLTKNADAVGSSGAPLTADTYMVIARRNNRVCPQPALWTRLYHLLEGSGYVDLPPPPVEPWIWTKLSHLQKRLRFREHIEWAERHGKLEQVARFTAALAESDWLHMGEV
jgi:hypothetical protein